MSDQLLMDYFKFDEADLSANRSGQITEKQTARLAGEDKTKKILSGMGGGCLLLIALFGLLGAIIAVMAGPGLGFKTIVGFGFGCFWPLLWGGVGIFLLSLAFRKFQVKLQRVEGAVNIVKAERTVHGKYGVSHYTAYELHIGGKSFDVNANLANIMTQGDVYDLYYTEGTENDILSAELISKAQ